MKKVFTGIFLLLVLFIIGLIMFVKWNTVEGTWRYRITVNVETPEGIKSGSAVRSVTDHASSIKIIDLPDVGGSSPELRGEAVVIDLGEAGTIFGLVNSSSYREVYAAFPFSGAKKAGDGLRYYLSLEPGTAASLPKQNWPIFVTFTDMTDPKSVVMAWGAKFNSGTQDYEPVDRMAELFGESVTIKSITLEITDEPVTWGVVDRYLPWLNDVGGKYLGRSRDERIQTYNLHGGNFKKGDH